MFNKLILCSLFAISTIHAGELSHLDIDIKDNNNCIERSYIDKTGVNLYKVKVYYNDKLHAKSGKPFNGSTYGFSSESKYCSLGFALNTRTSFQYRINYINPDYQMNVPRVTLRNGKKSHAGYGRIAIVVKQNNQTIISHYPRSFNSISNFGNLLNQKTQWSSCNDSNQVVNFVRKAQARARFNTVVESKITKDTFQIEIRSCN